MDEDVLLRLNSTSSSDMGGPNNSASDETKPRGHSRQNSGQSVDNGITSNRSDNKLSGSFDANDTGRQSALNFEAPTTNKLSKKESLRQQKKCYRKAKKRATFELMNMFRDQSEVIKQDYLKVRGTLKTWLKLYCVLLPEVLNLYKSHKTQKSSHLVGTVLLDACTMIERPSRKSGFCFKIYNPMDQSIWMPTKGQLGPLVSFNLPSDYLIFRTTSEEVGRCWMDALDLCMKHTTLRKRASFRNSALFSKDDNEAIISADEDVVEEDGNISPDEIENIHFKDHVEDENDLLSESDDDNLDSSYSQTMEYEETTYLEETKEDLGTAAQVEVVAEENTSILWSMLKQVRPGMDLSKVVLPTFILEPRSFLDKLSDYYYHVDLLSLAVAENDPLKRIKLVIKFFLSGFYKKPRGLKKPYNPILGETFRCCWQHPNGSRTFYVSEQISHHPPISCFHVTNRQEGFVVSGTILAKSKFYGSSVSALFEGSAKLTMLTRGEDYFMTFPYASVKGLVIGPLQFELGGHVEVSCEKTGYVSEIDFKLKPFMSNNDYFNVVQGKLKLGQKTIGTLSGKWDKEIIYTDKRTSTTETLWAVTPEVKSKRLKRFTVAPSQLGPKESDRLWEKVAQAIRSGEQKLATEEKFKLEEKQRNDAKERIATSTTWIPKFFELENTEQGVYLYKYADFRPWDGDNDVVQYEYNGVISTHTRHKIAPLARSFSSSSLQDKITSKASVASASVSHHSGSVIRRRKPCEIRRDNSSDTSQASKQTSDTSDGGINKVTTHSDSNVLEKLNEQLTRMAPLLSQQNKMLLELQEDIRKIRLHTFDRSHIFTIVLSMIVFQIACHLLINKGS